MSAHTTFTDMENKSTNPKKNVEMFFTIQNALLWNETIQSQMRKSKKKF